MRKIFFLAMIFCLSSCVSASLNSERNDLAAKIDKVALAAFQRTILEESPVSGFSLAVFYKGQILFTKGYGFADIAAQSPMTGETVFRIASITKQFTTAGIMLLVEEGQVNLDDPLKKYLPEYPEFENEISIRRLLTHTSGIGDYVELTAWPEMENIPLSRHELVKSFSKLPLLFNPGDQWYYSNSGYYLLGLVIEKVSRLSYSEFVKRRLVDKAGLKKTFYCPTSQDYPFAAKGYRTKKGQILPADPYIVDHAYAAGALCSTALDLIKWNEALASGVIIKEKSYELMTKPVILNDGKSTETNYGFGLELGSFLNHRMVSHGGDIKGFTSQLNFFPEDHLSIAILINTEVSSISYLGYTIARIVFDQLKDMPVSKEEAERIQGKYFVKEFEGFYTLAWKEKQLFATFASQDGGTKPPIKLLSQGDGSYWISEKGMNFRFDSGEGRAESLTIQMGNSETKGDRVD